jgi:hypothetical protein
MIYSMVTVRPTCENFQPYSALWNFEQGQGSLVAYYNYIIRFLDTQRTIVVLTNRGPIAPTTREHTAHWTKIRRSRARFSGLVASCRMP